MFFQQLVNGLTLGSAYAVIAIGYTLVFGVVNIVNMAHGGIFMIGAYIGLLLVTEAGMNIFPALAGAMIGGAVLGYGLELLALRPLRKHKATHLAPLISTIGVSTFLESVALMVWGPQTRSFPSAFGNELMDMGVFKISGIQIISLGTAVVLMVLLTVMLNRTKVGKAIRATSENAETAGRLGINTGRICPRCSGRRTDRTFFQRDRTDDGNVNGAERAGGAHHGRSRQCGRRHGRRFHSRHRRSIQRGLRYFFLS